MYITNNIIKRYPCEFTQRASKNIIEILDNITRINTKIYLVSFNNHVILDKWNSVTKKYKKIITKETSNEQRAQGALPIKPCFSEDESGEIFIQVLNLNLILKIY